jgi:hypothetical protein
MNHRLSLAAGASAAALLALLCSCSAPAPADVSSTQSALAGTVDAAAASDCATAYVNCVRVGERTCRDDLSSCISAATDASATAPDGGTPSDGSAHRGGGGRAKGGNCKADGTIDRAGLDGCLAALEICAASSSTALETCVNDAVTCSTASAGN